MIFLYFFIACAIIVGLYFAVELSVKYFENRKSKSEAIIEKSELLAQRSEGEIKNIIEDNGEALIVLNNEQDSADDLAKQELLGRLHNDLVFVVNEKQMEEMYEELHNALERITDTIKIKQQIRRRTYARSYKNNLNITQPLYSFMLNSDFKKLDKQIMVIEGYLNKYSNNMMQINNIQKRLKYSILVQAQNDEN